jgi:hypothetical protein
MSIALRIASAAAGVLFLGSLGALVFVVFVLPFLAK